MTGTHARKGGAGLILACGLVLAACAPHTPRSNGAETAAAPQPAAATPQFEEIAALPAGTFLENLASTEDGTVLVTSYFDRKILKLAADGQLSTHATLDVHPVGILALEDGIVVSAHGLPFTDQPAFTKTNQILFLDLAGEVVRVVPVPDGLFLNGLHLLDADTVLAADSLASTIWAISTGSGTVEPWLQSEALSIDPAASTFRPGANGLKPLGDGLLVSNSSRGTLHKVTITDGRPGDLELFSSPGPVDDFAIDAGGMIYAATHGEALLRIDPAGDAKALIETGCGACTSVALQSVDGGQRLIVLTTGHLLEGGTEGARILSVRLD